MPRASRAWPSRSRDRDRSPGPRPRPESRPSAEDAGRRATLSNARAGPRPALGAERASSARSTRHRAGARMTRPRRTRGRKALSARSPQSHTSGVEPCWDATRARNVNSGEPRTVGSIADPITGTTSPATGLDTNRTRPLRTCTNSSASDSVMTPHPPPRRCTRCARFESGSRQDVRAAKRGEGHIRANACRHPRVSAVGARGNTTAPARSAFRGATTVRCRRFRPRRREALRRPPHPQQHLIRRQRGRLH